MAPARARPLAIVTGANTGIGFHTASRLAAKGYHVVVASRSPDKGRSAAAAICAAGHSAEFMQVDLALLASTEAFAAAVSSRFTALHALVLNAGMNTVGLPPGSPERFATDSGAELCFATNFLSQWHLAQLLLPLMKATAASPGAAALAPVRLVTLSSVTHWLAPGPVATVDDWAAVIRGRGASRGNHSYSLSKLAAALFAYELTRRLGDEGVTGVAAVAVNPGAVDSDIWRTFPAAVRCACRPFMRAAFLTPAQGSETSVVAASAAADVRGTPLASGAYLTPYYQLASPPLPESVAMLTESLGPFAGARVGCSSSASHDAASARALWAACDAAVAAWRAGRAASATTGAGR
jgi:NAD(P)-dependent dehydrogenase (short-subunit alcohol dehydrogenase family)